MLREGVSCSFIRVGFLNSFIPHAKADESVAAAGHPSPRSLCCGGGRLGSSAAAPTRLLHPPLHLQHKDGRGEARAARLERADAGQQDRAAAARAVAAAGSVAAVHAVPDLQPRVQAAAPLHRPARLLRCRRRVLPAGVDDAAAQAQGRGHALGGDGPVPERRVCAVPAALVRLPRRVEPLLPPPQDARPLCLPHCRVPAPRPARLATRTAPRPPAPSRATPRRAPRLTACPPLASAARPSA